MLLSASCVCASSIFRRIIALPVSRFAPAFGVIELWLFGFHFGSRWLTYHKAAFVLWFLAMTVHVLAYVRRTPELAVADSRDHLGGALARRSLVVASVILGAVLVVAMLPFSSPFVLLPAGG